MELLNTSAKGIITLEILLAMTLLALIISQVLPLLVGQQSLLLSLQHYHQAINEAQTNLITMQSITKNPGSATKCATDVTSKANVGRTEVSFTARAVDVDEFWALGKDCEVEIFSQSQIVHLLEKIPLALGQTITGIDVLNDVVFISVVGGAPKESDLFAWQLGWQKAVSIDVGVGLSGLDVILNDQGDWIIFVANNQMQNQLQVLKFDGNEFTFLAATNLQPAPLGVNSMALSVNYYDQKVYLGTGYLPSLPGFPNRPEFQVFDVKNSYFPKHLGSFDVNHNINGIAVQKSVAYLATSDDNGELWELDVNRPSEISFLKKVDFAGNSDGEQVEVLDEQVVLRRTITIKDQENNTAYIP